MPKILHTSDWHIGRLFQSHSLLDDQVVVLNQIKEIAVSEQVDVLIVSGDIFDRAVAPAEAVDALDRFIADFIQTVKIPIVMISGNHDSEKRIRFGSGLMSAAGLHILGDITNVQEPVTITTATGEVDIYGIPFHDPVSVREKYDVDVRSYDQAHTFLVEQVKTAVKPGRTSVLMSHCFVSGATECDSERRLSVGGSDDVSYEPMESFDYVALGHLHAPQSKGAEHIRYSGSPLKYSFSEHAQSKSVTIVNFTEQGCEIHEISLKPVRDLRVIEGQLDDLIEQGLSDPNKEDFIFARLTDQEDLLEPMSRLRQSYPNTLQIERTQYSLKPNGEGLRAKVSSGKNEQEIFADFFKQVMDEDINAAQSALLLDVVEQAKKEMEGHE